jgi:hypothetical protein
MTTSAQLLPLDICQSLGQAGSLYYSTYADHTQMLLVRLLHIMVRHYRLLHLVLLHHVLRRARLLLRFRSNSISQSVILFHEALAALPLKLHRLLMELVACFALNDLVPGPGLEWTTFNFNHSRF